MILIDHLFLIKKGLSMKVKTFDDKTICYIKEVYYSEDDVERIFEDLLKILSGELIPSTLYQTIVEEKKVDEEAYGDDIYKIYED